ncbi:hypothetical protein CIB48_g7764 [Xylaria polymorpha]|nr:hypothetical protein CIB48_g7764 [Xylaria polymorpha]
MLTYEIEPESEVPIESSMHTRIGKWHDSIGTSTKDFQVKLTVYVALVKGVPYGTGALYALDEYALVEQGISRLAQPEDRQKVAYGDKLVGLRDTLTRHTGGS